MENNISNFARIKQALGSMQVLDFSDVTTEKFYWLLGKEVKSQIVKILNTKLSLMSEDEILFGINKTKLIWNNIYYRLQNNKIDIQIRNALEEYVINLKNWSEGAELKSYTHPALEKLFNKNNDFKLDTYDLALFLQGEDSGCQTGILRNIDGSISLWHTEEDTEGSIGDRFDQLRIVKFNMPNNKGTNIITYSFLYPDLLPGPAISWRVDGYVQAIDSLHLKTIRIENSIFSNIACWIALRLGKSVMHEKSIESLGPYVDGYAITVVKAYEDYVYGNVVEFAGEKLCQRDLSFQPNSYLFQVNQLSSNAIIIAEKYEEIDPIKKQKFHQRLLRTANAIEEFSRDGEVSERQLENLLCSQEGNDFAYSNEDVKSNFLIKIKSDELKTNIVGGPRLLGDKPIILNFKINTR